MAWTVRRGPWIWAVALLVAVPALVRTASLYLNLKSDIEALLPRNAPSVKALDELRARTPGLQHLGIVVDTGSSDHLAAGERFLDDLAARIRKYPASLVRRVRVGDEEERRFIGKNAVLYIDAADIRKIRERVERRRDFEVTRGLGLGLDDEEKPPPLDFSDIRKKYDARAFGRGAHDGARFSSPALHLTLLVVELAQPDTGRTDSEEVFNRVKRDVAALGGPRAYAPGMRIGFAGDVAISVEETSALRQDLSVSSAVVIVAVVFVILAYYRWRWSIVALMPPLLVATVCAFTLASLPPFRITELNSNTAFLGSIILGNGLNFGVLLLARYVEERRRGVAADEALAFASWGSRSGTLAASLAAGASYSALSVTSFQGFRQFGIIGGLGMLLSWGTAQLLLPPLVHWLDRGPRAIGADAGKHTPSRLLSLAVVRAPGVLSAVAVVLVVLAAWQARTLNANSIETDFSKLRRADTWVSGEGYWGRRMDALLGAYLTPIVILTDDAAETDRIERQLRERMKHPPFSEWISRVVTAKDVLPIDQREKLSEANSLRRVLTPRIRAQMTDDERRVIGRYFDHPDVLPFTERDLPPGLTTGLRERNGRIDRAVLVFPHPSRALWEGDTINRFVTALRDVARESGGRPGRVAGSLPVSRDILSGIRHDGPIASALALFGVLVTVVAVFGFTMVSALVITSLCIGVLWLLGAIVTLGVRINFANFIAFPITFGIGVDYAVNVMTRYVLDGSRDIARAIRTTGGAVALCSLTTTIGYSSLLLAQNRALFLFGVIAVLGEVTCLTSALIALPAAIELWNRRHARSARATV